MLYPYLYTSYTPPVKWQSPTYPMNMPRPFVSYSQQSFAQPQSAIPSQPAPPPPLVQPNPPVPASKTQNTTLQNKILWIAGGLGGAATLGGLAWFIGRKAKNQEPPSVQPDTSPIPAPISKPVPEPIPIHPAKLLPPRFKDPAHCDQIAFQIADETFPTVLKAMRDAPDFQPDQEYENGMLIRNEAANKALNDAVAKHLVPNCPVRITLFKKQGCSGYSGELGRDNQYGSPKHSKGSTLGALKVSGPVPETPTQIQRFYSLYCHELRHLVHGFVHQSQPVIPKKDDPFHDKNHLKDQYSLLMRHPVEFGAGGHGKTLSNILKKQYPECRDCSFGDIFKKQSLTPDQLVRCWKATNHLWQQTNNPLPMFSGELEQKLIPQWKKLFQKGDPATLDDYAAHILDEMQAYRTCVKRVPGQPAELNEDDLRDTAAFLYLRDLMRLYYQERNIPKDQQHPYVQPEYAKANPLKLIP